MSEYEDVAAYTAKEMNELVSEAYKRGLTDGTDNRMKHCPYCGKELKVNLSTPETSSEKGVRHG